MQALEDVPDDPVVIESGVLRPREDGGYTVAAPVDFGDHPTIPAVRAPEAGEHTEEVLLELGHDWAAIAALKDAGVIP